MPTTLRLERAAVGHLDADVVGAVDDVIVGEDVAVGPDDHARAEPAWHGAARRLRRLRTGRPKNPRSIGRPAPVPVGIDALLLDRTVTTAGATLDEVGVRRWRGGIGGRARRRSGRRRRRAAAGRAARAGVWPTL